MKSMNRFMIDEEAESMKDILEMGYAYQKSKVLLTACELNLFSALGDEDKTAEEVAQIIDTDPAATFRLMNALVSLNFLRKYGNSFSNTKSTRRFLVKDSPEFIGNLKHQTALYKRWANLTDTIKTGKTELNRFKDAENPEQTEEFISSMHFRAVKQAHDVVEMIYLSHAKKLLDLGGGSGAYSMEFVRAKPDLDVTVFDLPRVIPITKKYLDDNGFSDKIKTIPGDYFTDDLSGDYDIVFMSQVIHSNSIWENIELAKKIHFAMNPGGQIIIHDFIISDDRTKPVFTALFSLNMLINTLSGDTYTETDAWIMLKEAWFKDIKFQQTKFGTTIVMAKK